MIMIHVCLSCCLNFPADCRPSSPCGEWGEQSVLYKAVDDLAVNVDLNDAIVACLDRVAKFVFRCVSQLRSVDLTTEDWLCLVNCFSLLHPTTSPSDGPPNIVIDALWKSSVSTGSLVRASIHSTPSWLIHD